MMTYPSGTVFLGKSVKITDDGQLYDAWAERALEWSLKKWLTPSDRRNVLLEGLVGKVTRYGKHPNDSSEIVLGVDCDVFEIIIGYRGVELVEGFEDHADPNRVEFFNPNNLMMEGI